MNNVFVYIEIENTLVQEVSQELLTKGRKLANELGVELHAVVIGTGIKGQVEEQICLTVSINSLFSTHPNCSPTPRHPTPTLSSICSRKSNRRFA